MNPVRIVAPELPLTLTDCKDHMRVDHGDDDALITLYLSAAVDHLDGASGWLGRAIATQTWAETFNRFERRIRLAVAPVASISSVVYVDANGSNQTVASEHYFLEGDVLAFTDAYEFPTVRDQAPVLTITYGAGYSEMPFAIRAAILLMVGDMYQNREAKTENGMIDNPTVRALLDPYRRGWAA